MGVREGDGGSERGRKGREGVIQHVECTYYACAVGVKKSVSTTLLLLSSLLW